MARCDVPDCGRHCNTLKSSTTPETARSIHCKYHACHSADARFQHRFVPCANIAKQNSKYCAYHPKCHVRTCFNTRLYEDGRLGRFFCDQHTCRVLRCAAPASGHDWRCEAHKECAHGGCKKCRIKSPDGRGWLEVCGDHVIRLCAVQGCRCEARPNTLFCKYHKCIVETCPVSKHSGSNFCVAHTCGIEDCHLPINHLQAVVPNRPRSCLYCEVHECKTDHCHRLVTRRDGCCDAHGCTYEGCIEPRSSEANAGAYCIHHYTASVRRSAEQAGRHKEHSAAAERERKRKEEQREQEREARIARQEQERLDRLKAERDQAVEIANAYKRDADRLHREVSRKSSMDKLERLILQRQRRPSLESSTIGSASTADHPVFDYFHHGRETDHVYDTHTVSGYGDDSNSEDEYVVRGRERDRHISGVRHVQGRHYACR
ncbi:hypothetical protein MKZ38_003456 [Zalerion maritima]|uniref:Uncharacterized protein n=1 Tax=Zalerion maritima TaxID=339359 RepID=A0AAD5WUK6_9PEZI|nr:hypothetical protein MKZ38_003456 [Zalerion maritima]